MTGGAGAQPIVALAQAQTYARAETGEEEAILAGLVRTASSLCEAFLGQYVIERNFSEPIAARSDWQRLTTVPVREISEVRSAGILLPAGSFGRPRSRTPPEAASWTSRAGRHWSQSSVPCANTD